MTRQSVHQHIQGAERWVERIQVLDLLVQFPLACRIEAACRSSQKYFDKESQEIEIRLGWWKTERVDAEVRGFKPNAQIRTLEQTRQAFKAAAQVKDEREWVIFLEIGNQEIQKKAFSAARAAQDHGVGHVTVVQI